MQTSPSILSTQQSLASAEEPDASQALMGVFADEGIRVVRRAAVSSVRTDPATGGIIATAIVSGGQQEFRAARLLVATGRRPVTNGLNLATVGGKTGHRGEILLQNILASSHERIWAAGEGTGHPEFVYVAAAHGSLLVENAFNNAGREVDAAGIRCECRVLPLAFVPRALVNRDTRGFIQIVADADNGRIVGMTAVAKDAGDLAAAGVFIMEAGMTVEQVANLWSAYLTMAEGIKIAAQSFTTDVSKLSCCAS
ncbi:Mercuric reductase [Arthrobacter sp. ES1]|nr:Mercuric reductase [Arthrobacter sp. ES1]